MRHRTWTIPIGLAVFALSLPRCSSGPNVAGTISQSGNGVIEGRIVTAAGPAPNAMVRVRPESYLASRGGQTRNVRDVTADLQGYFLVDSLDTGAYRVEASVGAEAISVLCALSIGAMTADLGALPPLRPCGTIVGKLDGVNLGAFPWYVQAGGLERLTVVGDAQNGVFTLSNVPAGAYRIVITPSQPGFVPLEHPGVVVNGGDTVRITIVL